ncbi:MULTISPECIES: nucleotide-binding protein [Microcystis]|uniref:nucleotide-binding protein n=1 Tax=Microcystis TaxID=1125 RepID=UPI0005C707D0|nr:nucleotide-binding protein [Microcystis aeruginosa]
MKIIVNSIPIIALSLINQLDILNQLFNEVIIPWAVYQEIVIAGDNKPGAKELKNANWIQVQEVASSSPLEPLLLGLDRGELEVILLAISIKPDWVIIDEKLARRVAKAMELPVKGTLGILLVGFDMGYLSKQEILDLSQQLVDYGIRISSPMINWLKTELDNDH